MFYRIKKIFPFFILTLMFFLGILSMKDDSAIRDEMPHIVAGYSYLKKNDYRINPEHPPLIKQLSAVPLFFLDLNFPENSEAWNKNINDQWKLGHLFLYESNNDAQKMLFWARLPVLILSICLGYIIYSWSKAIFKSELAGLFSLLLYAFSPNILAHSRFVTTDLGVTAFSVFALYSWWVFLKNPSWKKFILASILHASLFLSKFSAPLFLPAFFLLTIFTGFFQKNKNFFNKKKADFKLIDFIKKEFFYLKVFCGSLLVIVLLIGLWYQGVMWHMPEETQRSLIRETLPQDILQNTFFGNAMHLITNKLNFPHFPVLKGLAQYFLGFLMVKTHADFGHSTFFLGDVGDHWWYYYFAVYLLKEPLPAIIIPLIACCLGLLVLIKIIKTNDKNKRNKLFFLLLKKYYILLIFIFIILEFFWIGSRAKLQLGIRYILPTFPYLYIISGGFLGYKLEKIIAQKWKEKRTFLLIICISFLYSWLLASNLATFPHYLAYSNEISGGYQKSWHYLSDSNVDWGQDLLRLKKIIQEKQIQNPKIDYFGGGDLTYYLGKGNYIQWSFEKGETTGWIILSANTIQWNSKNDAKKGNYHWLTENHQPIYNIGGSILIYYVNPLSNN